jgi:hypothetical protein
MKYNWKLWVIIAFSSVFFGLLWLYELTTKVTPDPTKEDSAFSRNSVTGRLLLIPPVQDTQNAPLNPIVDKWISKTQLGWRQAIKEFARMSEADMRLAASGIVEALPVGQLDQFLDEMINSLHGKVALGYLARALVGHLAKQDPMQALTAFKALQECPQRFSMGSCLAGVATAPQFESADFRSTFVKTLCEDVHSPSATKHLESFFCDLASCFRWVDVVHATKGIPRRSDILTQYFVRAVSEDGYLGRIKEAVSECPEDADLAMGAFAALKLTSVDNPENAGNFLNELPSGATFDLMRAAYALSIAKIDPSAASKWKGIIKDPEALALLHEVK